LPPVSEVPIPAPLDKQVLDDLRLRIQEYERGSSTNVRGPQQQPTRLDRDAADKLFAALQNFVVREKETWEYFSEWYGTAYPIMVDFVTRPDFELIHLVRWCLLLTGRRIDGTGYDKIRWTLTYAWREPFIRYQKARKKQIDLRELAAVFRALGLDDQMIGRQLLQVNQYSASPFSNSEPDTIWPYFAERFELLE